MRKPLLPAWIRSILRVHLALGVGATGILFWMGYPGWGWGVFFGTFLGGLNGLLLAGQLEEALIMDPQRAKRHFLIGIWLRFLLILGLMGAGFHWFSFPVLGVLAGFLLFLVVAGVTLVTWVLRDQKVPVRTDRSWGG